MDKDNSQESMISSNSPSFGKSRGEAYYSSNPTFYVGIDCIIFGFNEGEISLLLLKRNFEPAMGEWSLMGGFVQNNESVDDAAKRVLHELTGLENVYMEQVGTFGAIDRDPGERVISVAYYALININEYDRKLVQKHNAYWVNMNELPPLIFDHPEMVEKARAISSAAGCGCSPACAYSWCSIWCSSSWCCPRSPQTRTARRSSRGRCS